MKCLDVVIDTSGTLAGMTTTNSPQEPDDRWTRPDFILGYIATWVSTPGIGEDRVIEHVRYALIMHAKATGSFVLAAVLGIGDDPQT